MRHVLLPSLVILASVALLVGCSRISAPYPPPSTPPAPSGGVVGVPERSGLGLPMPREARASVSGLAQHAQQAFWEAFYAGNYGALNRVTALLTAAYLENPLDPDVTLLLAHAHLWRVAERRRIEGRDPTDTDHLVLAEAYFEEAYRLAPDDHRTVGWLGSVRTSLGALRQDSALARKGYDLLEEAARRYPQFNHFTAGFALSGLPADDPRYAEALEHMWANVVECLGGIDAPSVYEVAVEADPACANTEKAPHNYEGFMLNLGDMLVKSGEPERARSVYGRAQLSPTYDEWPYRDRLEQRVLNADEAAALFARAARADGDVEAPEMLLGSAYSCAVCHQR